MGIFLTSRDIVDTGQVQGVGEVRSLRMIFSAAVIAAQLMDAINVSANQKTAGEGAES